MGGMAAWMPLAKRDAARDFHSSALLKEHTHEPTVQETEFARHI
jgi:hypothetical protein